MINGFSYTDIGILSLALILCLVILLSKNIVQVMMSFLSILVVVGIVFLLQNSGFLFVTQLLLYVGGVTVFLIFAIMLSKRITKDRSLFSHNQNLVIGGILGIGLVSLFYWVFQSKAFQEITVRGEFNEIRGLGIGAMSTYLFPFELLAILLLIALILAAVIAGKKNEI